jgi:putative membrane protein
METSMNRIARWGFALAILPMAACTGNNVAPMAATVPQPAAAAPTVNPVDQQFAMQAGASDQFEIQSSQIALQKSHSARVRQFAQRMIDAHTQTTQQLTQIGSSKGMAMQPVLQPEQQKMLADLQAMDGGRAFDRAYLNDQVVAHSAAATLFQNEIANGQDPQIKAFAQQTLPIIQDHLRDARRLGDRG